MSLQWAYDFAKVGAEVHAVAAGTVVYVEDNLVENSVSSQWWTGYGNVITIESTINGNTFYTTYAHLAPNSTKLHAGSTVTAGENIAKTGDTGTFSPIDQHLHPHLHIQFGSKAYLGTLNNTTLLTGIVADGQSNQTSPAYFSELRMNFNENGNDIDKVYNGTNGVDVFLGNAKGDTVNGYNGNDVLVGGAGKDKLNGGSGDDTLSGRLENDLLTGGPGSDHFLFNAPAEGVDHIVDFNHAEHDSIELLAAGFPGLTASTDVASIFGSSANNNFNSTGERLHFNSTTHTILYDADGSGTAFAAVQLAKLENNYNVVQSDFHLI